jgi:putative ABC transport system ATP-binding protein
MQIRLSHVLPEPLEGMQYVQNSLWHHGDFVFEQSKTYEIVASSGKGKTTLLDIIFGRRNDYKGQLLIDEVDVSHFSLNQWANVRSTQLSYVFQGLRLFKHLTGWQNIELKNRLSGTIDKSTIIELADKLSIADQLEKKAGLMSYGQQQRLAIIRAFAQPFEWLLLDEPFSHLDKDTSLIAAQLIQQLCEERNAGLIVTKLNEEAFLTGSTQIIL